jgi:hypothetical protein
MPSTYAQIATYTFPSAAASYTFTSIPDTYTDLILVGDCLSTNGGGVGLSIQFNSDTGNNYLQVGYYSSGSGSANNSFNSGDKIYVAIVDNTERSGFKTDILNYSSTATFKNTLSHGGQNNYLSGYVGMWKNSTDKINSIKVLCDGGSTIKTDSKFSLYGILKA